MESVASESASSAWSAVSEDLIRDPDNFEVWEKLIEEAERGSSSSSNAGGYGYSAGGAAAGKYNGAGAGGAESNQSREGSRGGKYHSAARRLSKVSPSSDIAILRVSYRALLAKFPLLHQYWINLSQWEFHLGHTDAADHVFQDALLELPYSVEIWTAYLKFKVVTMVDDVDGLLALFERARSKIGLHYHSHEFYDLYLAFLKEQGSSNGDELMRQRYVILLRIVIEVPLYHYGKFFNQLMAVIDEEQGAKLSSYLIPAKEVGKLTKEKGPKLSAKLKKTFTDVYITTQYKSYQLYQFEKGITRPYFHVSYLSEDELANWASYLDYLELSKYPQDLIQLTYERCLVTTALYPQFWIRYADYFISSGKKIETAKQTLLRGIAAVPQTNYSLKLKLCDLEIFQGQYLKARDLVITNLRLQPDALPYICKLLQLERLMNPADDDYLLELVENLSQGRSDYEGFLFREVLLYNVDSQKLSSFFAKHAPSEASLNFWNSYMEIQSKEDAGDEQYKTVYESGILKLEKEEDRRAFAKKWKSARPKDYKAVYAESLKAFK